MKTPSLSLPSLGTVIGAIPSKGVREINDLIDDVFLTKTSKSHTQLIDMLTDFGDHILRDIVNSDVVFTKRNGNTVITVKGQVPRNPGQGVVLVIDFDKADGTKFTPDEKEALRATSFKLHFKDPSSSTALRDIESKRVLLTERGDSMSCGFWPTTFGGPRILTKLTWNYFLPPAEQLKYASDVLKSQKDNRKSIVIDLNLNR